MIHAMIGEEGDSHGVENEEEEARGVRIAIQIGKMCSIDCVMVVLWLATATHAIFTMKDPKQLHNSCHLTNRTIE